MPRVQLGRLSKGSFLPVFLVFDIEVLWFRFIVQLIKYTRANLIRQPREHHM